MNKYKITGILMTLCLAVSCLTGCKIGNTEIQMEAGQIKNHRTVFRINDDKCDIRIAKLYLCNYRNLYGCVYGLDLWQNESKDLEQYVKDVTLQELSRITCMKLLAKEQGLSLDESEEKLIKAAAEEYYASLNEAELSFMDVKKSDVEAAYEDYALAEKLYNSLIQGIDEEVSDDEARVIRVQQIIVKDEKEAASVEEKLKAGADFATVAGMFRQDGDIETVVSRGDYPQEVENIAFNLDDGECSEMISVSEGFYFIECLSKYEEELTEANKETIRAERKKEQFENSYQKFVDASSFQMNDTLWEEVSLDHTEGIETDSFFAVYDKYFQ